MYFHQKFLKIAKPDISSMNRTFTLINFYSFGFRMMHSLGKMGKDLFRNLKQQSCEFYNSFQFEHILIPNTKTTFFMNFWEESVNFKSMSMYIYYYWDND